jgi:hypothetical protein
MLFNNSLRGSKYKSEINDYDHKKILLEEKKINKDFLNRIKLLTLEELIYLKLDSISSSLNGKLLGIPINKFLPDICQEALMLFAVTKGKNKRDIATSLGIDLSNLNKLLRRYKLDLKGKRYDRSK